MSTVFDAAREFLADSGLRFADIGESIEITVVDPVGKWTATLIEAHGCFVCSTVYPLNVPAPRRAAMAELLARLNYGLLIGNWEMDFRDGEVRYRTSVPARSCLFTADLARDLAYTNFGTFGRAWPMLTAVLSGAATPAAAVEDGRRRRRAKARRPKPPTDAERQAFADLMVRFGFAPGEATQIRP